MKDIMQAVVFFGSKAGPHLTGSLARWQVIFSSEISKKFFIVIMDFDNSFPAAKRPLS